jgi:type II secretory pathway pseudopilin PulG
MKRAPNKRLASGSFLAEALIAIGVLAMIAGSIVVSLSGQLNAAQSSKETATATAYAQEGIEAARTIRNTGWDGLAIGAHGVGWINGSWGFSGTSDSTSTFTRVVNVMAIDDHDRRVDSIVTWSSTPGYTRALALTTILSDWRNAAQVNPGGDLRGDWCHPSIIGTNFNFGSNFRATAVDTDQNLLGLAGFGTVSMTNDLALIDITDPQHPVMHGAVSTGVGVSELSIDATRHYAYLANSGTSNQLQIVDISNIDAPRLVNQYTIPGNVQKGRSIDRVGNLVYFGTEGPSDKEFSIIDVTDVMNPVLLGDVSVGNDINDIMVYGDYAYLATDVNGKEITVVNVHNYHNPKIAAYSNIPGPQYAEMVYYDHATERAYISRQTQNGQGTQEVAVYDVSDKTNLVRIGNGLESDSDVNGIMSEGNLLFVVSSGDMEFRSFVADDPSDLRLCGGVDLGSGIDPTDIVYKDNVFYLSIFDETGIRIITTY